MTLKEYNRGNTDVVLQIIHELKCLNETDTFIKITHIKGHQDKNIKFDVLSRPAQLNAEADEWATRAESCKAPLHHKFPANSIQLEINDQIITSDHAWIWRKATLSQDFREYMGRTYKWKSSAPDKIWWKIMGPALDKFKESDRTIQKIIYK